MAVRAAWLHYAGGHTQAEVADKLGLSKLKAHRLITRANREGMVKVYIDGDVAECIHYEKQLSKLFSLEHCEVVPEFDTDALPLKALGAAGGQYFRRLLGGDMAKLVGIGHGRTLAACIENIPRSRSADVQFVSLLGGFSEKFAANPHDVIHRLAERTGAQAYVMPVPFLANSIEDREVLIAQRGLQSVFDTARNTELKVVGIGSVTLDSSLVASGMVDESEFAEVAEAGGVGELLGHFFAKDGSSIENDLSQRTMGLTLEEIDSSKVVAIAGGEMKPYAIAAVLRSGLLSGLITDERTARALITAVE